MKGISLEFDPPDLAGWLWVAVAALAAAEALRFARARRPLPAALVVLAGATVGALKLGGLLRLDASSHAWACLWIGPFAVVWLVRAYLRTTRAITRRLRRILLTLRVAASLIVLFLLASPVLQSLQVRHERALLGLLLDDSRSMTVLDVDAGDEAHLISRLDAVNAALERNRKSLTRLRDELDVRIFEFDAETRESSEALIEGRGAATALADAIEYARERLGETDRKTAGIIVISDGRDNASADDEPEAAGDSLATSSVPLYAVGIGSEKPVGQTRSLQARRIDCPDRVAVMNRLLVHAEFAAVGLAGTPIEVELLVDDQPVARELLPADKVGELISVDFADYAPEQGGMHRVTVRATAAALADEPSGAGGGTTELPRDRGRAELSRFVRVTDDQIRVLYIDRPRYERAAVARALESAKELQVRKIDLNRPADAGTPGPLSRIEADWQAYQVILIGDVDRRMFGPGTLDAIRKLVTGKGCGLGLLGGVRTLGSGAYRQTALEELLPVDLGAVGELPGPITLELTPAGRSHPVCQVTDSPEDSAARFRQLPAMSGAGRLGEIGAAAEVLIRSMDGEPLMVVQETGKGRTAAIAFDSTWRWPFAGEESAEAHRRFWRQLVLWLAIRKPDVWVTPSKPRFDLLALRAGKDRVVLRAGVADASTGGPLDDVKITGTIAGPDDRTRELQWLSTTDGSTIAQATPAVDRAGEYSVTVEAQSGGRTVGRSETAFVVSETDVELADAVADLETLRRMARRTERSGGKYLPLQELDQLLDEIRAARHVTRIRQVRRWNLADDLAWWWFAAFLALVTAEWVARRRAGLV